MIDSDLKELCVVLLFLKFVETEEEKIAIQKSFDLIKKIRNFDFSQQVDD